MKVIFLDYYGVMDGSMEAGMRRMDERREARARGEELDYDPAGLDPDCGVLVNRLIELTDAVIVIISDAAVDWTLKDDWIEWDPAEHEVQPWWGPESSADKLTAIGIPRERVVGWTHQVPSSTAMFDRPREIRDWLDQNPNVTAYVVLDDKPLPFSNEDIEATRARINSWENQKVPNERWLNALLPLDNGMAHHFIQVDGREALTERDIENAARILNGAVGDLVSPG